MQLAYIPSPKRLVHYVLRYEQDKAVAMNQEVISKKDRIVMGASCLERHASGYRPRIGGLSSGPPLHILTAFMFSRRWPWGTPKLIGTVEGSWLHAELRGDTGEWTAL